MKSEAIGRLTFLEFAREDHEVAQALCRRLGYGESYAYASTSDLPGLYCLPTRNSQNTTVICKTVEFGLVAVQTFEG